MAQINKNTYNLMSPINKNTYNPSYWVHKYKMDQENYSFKRQEFINELSKSFLEAIQNYPIKNPKTNAISYNNFKRLIKTFRTLFEQISLQKMGKPLSDGLWKAFYAQGIISQRKVLYPRVQDKIDAHKAMSIGNRVKIS